MLNLEKVICAQMFEMYLKSCHANEVRRSMKILLLTSVFQSVGAQEAFERFPFNQ